jgi:hypothetical protein
MNPFDFTQYQGAHICCIGKHAYPNYATAQRHLTRKRRVRPKDTPRIYKCRLCRSWHIGAEHSTVARLK